MQKKTFLSVSLLIIMTGLAAWVHAGKAPRLTSPYLGQKPPGLTPELFAPGVVSTGLDELNSVFSPDGSEFYFCVRNIQGAASIFQMKMEKGAWSKPRLLPFASRFGDIDVSISPAGDALLFSSLRPRPGEAEPRKDNDFWLAPRKWHGWGEAVHLGQGINSDSHDYYPLMVRTGAIYFSSQREGPGTNNIYRAEKVDGAFLAAVKLGEAVNTQYREFDPYVSPGEDLLIFASNRPGGLGSSDLYVSFLGADGAWTPAVNLGEKVNSPGPEFCPMLSPDGKYLFFTSYRIEQGRIPADPVKLADFAKAHNLPGNGLGDIYWVSAEVIEALRPRADETATREAVATGNSKVAIATFVSLPEQERAVKALIKSVRELSGNYKASTIYVVTADPAALPCESLRQNGVEMLPLEMDRAFLDYPLALKAFAAAQVEKKTRNGFDTLIWLDPGVIVLNSLGALDLGKDFDAALRPVTLANTIGIPHGSEPNDYWQPIYRETGLDYTRLPVLTTVADEQEIQPYYNCEVFSFNPKLGLAQEWARLLTRFLKDENYQKTVCTTFLRKLFLHQAVLSAVISSRIKPERIRALPLTSGYPFSQHEKLPAAKKSSSLNEVSVVIFDRTWQQDEQWLQRIPSQAPLREWLQQVYQEYLHK